jgi:hypothetical protein
MDVDHCNRYQGLLLCEVLSPKTTLTATNNVNISKHCVKPLNEREQED